MKKLTQDEVLSLISDLDKAIDYLSEPDLKICQVDKGTPYGTSYVNKEGVGLSEFCKFTGSNLCYLLRAKEKLVELFNKYRVKTATETQIFESYKTAKKFFDTQGGIELQRFNELTGAEG